MSFSTSSSSIPVTCAGQLISVNVVLNAFQHTQRSTDETHDRGTKNTRTGKLKPWKAESIFRHSAEKAKI